LAGLEFYFDFKEDNIQIEEDMTDTCIDRAKENDCLFNYVNKETHEKTETYYSPDVNVRKSRKSSFIIYNKNKKDDKDNQIAKDAIRSNEYSIRCEFRLYSTNSVWLNYDNLKGSYKDVFNNYKELLAVLYNSHVKGCITTIGRTNKNFNAIKRISEKNNAIRYRGRRLKKAEPMSKTKQPDKITVDKRTESCKLLDDFCAKKSNVEKSGKMTELMLREAKNRQGYYMKC